MGLLRIFAIMQLTNEFNSISTQTLTLAFDTYPALFSIKPHHNML